MNASVMGQKCPDSEGVRWAVGMLDWRCSQRGEIRWVPLGSRRRGSGQHMAGTERQAHFARHGEVTGFLVLLVEVKVLSVGAAAVGVERCMGRGSRGAGHCGTGHRVALRALCGSCMAVWHGLGLAGSPCWKAACLRNGSCVEGVVGGGNPQGRVVGERLPDM